eukprot:scaffold248919_cov22-Tisochrysis_lutea.AAC.1
MEVLGQSAQRGARHCHAMFRRWCVLSTRWSASSPPPVPANSFAAHRRVLRNYFFSFSLQKALAQDVPLLAFYFKCPAFINLSFLCCTQARAQEKLVPRVHGGLPPLMWLTQAAG